MEMPSRFVARGTPLFLGSGVGSDAASGCPSELACACWGAAASEELKRAHGGSLLADGAALLAKEAAAEGNEDRRTSIAQERPRDADSRRCAGRKCGGDKRRSPRRAAGLRLLPATDAERHLPDEAAHTSLLIHTLLPLVLAVFSVVRPSGLGLSWAASPDGCLCSLRLVSSASLRTRSRYS